MCIHSFIHLEKYKTDLHQIYVNDELRDKDDRFKFWVERVEVEGHGGIKCAANS